MPKISFILPAYKRCFLKEAIASIVAQTYRDFELIVVDDCSPEDLKEVVDEFHDSRLTYHRNEKNMGGNDLVACWNNALEHATGEWVVCAGDDDIYHSEFLEELISLAEKYPQVDIVHCRIACINSSGDWTWIGAPRAEYETPAEMLYHCGVLRCEQRIGDLMIRRAALRSMGGYVNFPRAWCSDHSTSILLAMKGGAACSGRILFYWRCSTNNISTQFEDALIKIQAQEHYRLWLTSVVKSIQPVNREDAQILRFAQQGIGQAVDRLNCWLLDQTPFLTFLQIMCHGSLSRAFKFKMIWRRVKRGVSPMRLLKRGLV